MASVEELQESKKKLLRHQKKLDQLIASGKIQNYHDICGEGDPSFLFPFIIITVFSPLNSIAEFNSQFPGASTLIIILLPF